MLRTSGRGAVGLVIACLAGQASAGGEEEHLRAGAAHFRAGRFDEAVVEFKVARALGAGGECPWYIAAALTRSGRHLEALEAFEAADELAPESADGLFQYFRGVACSETQLVVCASTAFELSARSAGPKVAAQARRLAAEARGVLASVPPRAAIDALLLRAQSQVHNGNPRLAQVFVREAAALSARREDRWREPVTKQQGLPDAGAVTP